MLKNFIRRLLVRRHYWRHIGFDELSELYVSSMFRSLAISLIGIFVPIYLLQQGYLLHEVLVFYGILFSTRLVADVLAGFSVAKWGPKHTMLLANLGEIGVSALLVTLPRYGWPAWIIAVVWGISLSLHFIAYHTDFSKIKHTSHGGKELGWMNIMERGGRVAGPVIGGAVATVFGAQYTFLAAVVVLVISVIPLFLTAEPVKSNQKLDFKGLVPSQMRRDIFAFAALHLENTVSIVIWPIFLAFFVLTGFVYAELGMLSSVSIAISMLAAYAIGKLIDRHHGRLLLRYAASANAVVHIFRPFVNSVPMALGISIVKEAVTVGYWLPFYKGLYDNADSWPGHRIVYIVTLEVIGEIMKAAVCFGLAYLALFMSGEATMTVAFGLGAAASLFIMTERFRALNPWRLLYGFRKKH